VKKLIFLLVIAVAAGGWFFLSGGAAEKSATTREVHVQRGDINRSIIATGVVQPQNRLEIKPPIPGRIEDILVVEGQTVERGSVLGWMSSTDRAALLDAARAKGPEELARWEERYKPAPIIAPLSGLIIARKIEPGQTVTSQDVMLVMSDHLIVEAQVDETDIGDIRLQQPAVITLDAYPNEVISADVTQIAYEAETVNNVTIYNVDVLPKSVPDFMKSGMTADVTFIIEEERNILLIPVEAVINSAAGPKVRKVITAEKEADAIKDVPVELGLSDGRNVRVIKGLTEGDRLIIPQGGILNEGPEVNNPFMPFRRPTQQPKTDSGAKGGR
jgi:macrolide-specific efflux system membrane fusion protein